MKTSIPFLVLLCLAALVVAACAGSSTPASVANQPALPGLTALPTVESRTETPSPSVDSVTVIPSPTIPKPTATFVPLTTPSPTPTGDRPNQNSVRRIEVAEARALAEAGDAILVDVRPQGTYKEAHIVGAVSLPLDEVAERVHTLGDEVLIIFYCA